MMDRVNIPPKPPRVEGCDVTNFLPRLRPDTQDILRIVFGGREIEKRDKISTGQNLNDTLRMALANNQKEKANVLTTSRRLCLRVYRCFAAVEKRAS